MSSVLFIGGTGQISLPCVARAAAEGHEVTVLNRGETSVPLPDGVKSLVGDMAAENPYAALEGKSFDVICQFKAFTPDQVERDIAAFSGRVGQYVFISSASVYEKPARHYVITEKTPTVNPFWKYSQDKIACEAMLKANKSFPWTIVRPSHTMRVGLPTQLVEGDDLGRRMIEGKPVLVSGDGTSPWTLTRPVDFAVPFVRLFGKDGAVHEDFHITQDRAYTWDQIYHALARGLGVEPNIVHVPAETILRYQPDWAGPLMGDKMWAALFDNSKIKALVGDFDCESDIEKVVADSVTNFKARAAKSPVPVAPYEDLMDRIAKEQAALGR